MDSRNIYNDIAHGKVMMISAGPVRTGKSTFIK